MDDAVGVIVGVGAVVLLFALFVVPYARILYRLGLSPWWSLVFVIPLMNIVALWCIAFVEWPAVDKPAADRPLRQREP